MRRCTFQKGAVVPAGGSITLVDPRGNLRAWVIYN
jgi:hypothetical protein